MSRPDWINYAETNGYTTHAKFDKWLGKQNEVELFEDWLEGTQLGAAMLADLGEQYQMESIEDVYALITKHYKDEYGEYLYDRYREENQ